jgi:hypothetical protein
MEMRLVRNTGIRSNIHHSYLVLAEWKKAIELQMLIDLVECGKRL